MMHRPDNRLRLPLVERPRRTLIALAAALALLISACGSGGDNAETTAAAPAAANDSTDSGDAADPFPAFVGTTSDGAAFDLEAHRGDDIVLWFWAPW